MKHIRKKISPRLSKDANNLIDMAHAAVFSGSRAETVYWNAHIETLATNLLDTGGDAALEAALDEAYKTNPDAHDLLAESIEAAAESAFFEVDGVGYQALLISVPIIAWSKYNIASGKMNVADIVPLENALRAYVLADGAMVSLSAYLYSIDQLPQSFSGTRVLLKTLAEAAMNGDLPAPYSLKQTDTPDMPADSRMLLGVVLAPRGQPLFRWQVGAALDATGTAAAASSSKTSAASMAKKTKESAIKNTKLDKAAQAAIAAKAAKTKSGAAIKNATQDATNSAMSRTECLTNWVAHGKPLIAKLIPGATFECGLPDGFFHNCRECDRRVRPHMMRGAVDHLVAALSTSPAKLHAIIASVGEAQVDEYRVGFALKSNGVIVNGAIWPLIGEEDDDTHPGPREEIEAILKAAHVGTITKLPGLLPPEACEDCGAPLFYDADAEAVHPQMPDDSNQSPQHYH